MPSYHQTGWLLHLAILNCIGYYSVWCLSQAEIVRIHAWCDVMKYSGVTIILSDGITGTRRAHFFSVPSSFFVNDFIIVIIIIIIIILLLLLLLL